LFGQPKRKAIQEAGKRAPWKSNNILQTSSQGWGQLDLKSMYIFIRLLRWKIIIQKEIMIHFGHLKLTTNNQKPYMDDE
jgi:hypothetical protein